MLRTLHTSCHTFHTFPHVGHVSTRFHALRQVLVERIRAMPGTRVVAVVGKAHLPGIQKLWNQDTTSLAAAALEEPAASVVPRLVGVAAVAGLPLAAYRYRAVRLGLGGLGLGLVAGGSWLTLALRDRLRFFERNLAASAVTSTEAA